MKKKLVGVVFGRRDFERLQHIMSDLPEVSVRIDAYQAPTLQDFGAVDALKSFEEVVFSDKNEDVRISCSESVIVIEYSEYSSLSRGVGERAYELLRQRLGKIAVASYFLTEAWFNPIVATNMSIICIGGIIQEIIPKWTFLLFIASTYFQPVGYYFWRLLFMSNRLSLVADRPKRRAASSVIVATLSAIGSGIFALLASDNFVRLWHFLFGK